VENKPLLSNESKTTVTIETEGKERIVIEFSELSELSVDHDIRAKERPDGYLDHECRSTLITLRGRLVGAPKHEHKWKQDSFGPTSEESDPLHYGLTCECGATACGMPSLSEVHNIREYGE
jgi:hypothetical protein